MDHPVLTWKFLYTHLDTGELILGIWFFFYLEQFSGVKSFCQPRHFDLGTQFCNFYTNDSRQNLILTIWVYLFCWKFDMLIPNYSVIRKVNIFNFDRFRAIFSGTIFFVTRQVLPWNYRKPYQDLLPSVCNVAFSPLFDSLRVKSASSLNLKSKNYACQSPTTTTQR